MASPAVISPLVVPLSKKGFGGAGSHGQRTDDGGDDGADGVDDDPPVVVGNLAHSCMNF